MPSLHSDAEAVAFTAEADLTQYDLSGFKPMRFEIARKEAALNMRIPAALLDAIKAKAASKGLPYSRYVRMLLEADIARSR
ncbi:MAG: BrnA antitoxin family protein [Betaproteobacteria bacterium]|nr:BrnA antitoxin family protein [Betaproteobacteria bacterium]MDE1955052.1 BrnA antitoxin family protein [Betaproteobacteria bacterium]MDE2154202.1 BrnA antitoxin family protein [Betaproteobacteria bacterium]